jgi:FkbM family methyltransferase
MGERGVMAAVQSGMSADPSALAPLIYDVGFNNGDDSFYYLSRGFRVVAVEANPALADEGNIRFAAEIASGRLTIVNAALWEHSGDTVKFFVNETELGQSSLDAERGKRGGKYREITVGTVSIADLFAQYGVPWYLKIDIEGADEMVIRSLPRTGVAPKYLSFEVAQGCPAIELLAPLGYTGFKLINPETLTQSLPIFEHEFGLRLLRKPSVRIPRFRAFIAGLPDSIRPKKTLWDRTRDQLGYNFSTCATGPFAEETAGPWKTGDEMKRWLEHVYREYNRAGASGQFWYDLHAKNAAAA